MGRICLGSLGYARRRWPGLSAVSAAMLLKIGLDVVKPWPMKVLVDHVLYGRPMPEGLEWALGLLPAAATREQLLTWCVAGTVALFLAGWTLGLASSLAGIAFGQRLAFD